MRAVVTGGAGFIGSHLSERLAQQGHEVLAIDNLASGSARVAVLESKGVELETADIRQEKTRSLIAGFSPEVVFHLAAQIEVGRSVEDPILDAKVNVIGLLRVLEAARDAGARVIFTSSGGTIYGEVDPAGPAATEETLGQPSSPYGITKGVAGDYLRFYRDTHGLDFVSLALGNVYGPRQDPHGEAGVVAIFARRLVAAEECTFNGDGKHTRDYVYVGDVVDATLLAVSKGAGETINIGTGEGTSVEELYFRLAEICGVDRPPKHGPERPGDLRHSRLDNTKAGKVLGWKPATSLDQGMRATVDWFSRIRDSQNLEGS
jgi:UDP-glucose 4-epimerase